MNEYSKYDVAVIGAGIVGLTSAYHISMNNPGLKIVVIDKAASYAQGNTGRATAGFRDLFSSQVNFELASSTIAFYRYVQEVLRFDMGMRFVGYMALLDDEGNKTEVLEELEKKTSVTVLEGDQLQQIKSLIRDPGCDERALIHMGKVTSAYIGLNCGILEPDLVTSFYYTQLRKLGVDFIFSSEVRRLVLKPCNPLDFPGEPFIWQKKIVSSAETNRGIIEAETFILATDVWTSLILDPLGIDSHSRPRKRQVFQMGGSEIENMLSEFSVNDTGVFPFTILPRLGIHFRPAPNERKVRVSAPDYVGRDFSLEEMPEAEPTYYEYGIRPVLQCYFPSFRKANISGMWAGFYSENSLDSHPFIFREMNLIVATGTSGSGLMKGDAIGRAVSSLYASSPKTRLYGGGEIQTGALGVTERDVPVERFLL